MKKFIIFFAMILIGFSESQAQDTLKVKLGFFFVPQGVFDIRKAKDGFSTITPVFAVASFNKGNSIVNVMYNMTFNNVQVVYAQQFSSVFGMYLAANKHILAKGGYTGIGATRSVMDGKASVFFEIGSGWNNWEPTIYTGVIIPLVFRIK